MMELQGTLAHLEMKIKEMEDFPWMEPNPKQPLIDVARLIHTALEQLMREVQAP